MCPGSHLTAYERRVVERLRLQRHFQQCQHLSKPMQDLGMTTYRVGGAVREAVGTPHSRNRLGRGGRLRRTDAGSGLHSGRPRLSGISHPVTKEEFALARTERKSGQGHHGFVVHASPSVTLEEDLRRRDLTVNAAATSEDGTIIDPYGGRARSARENPAARFHRTSSKTRSASCGWLVSRPRVTIIWDFR